MITQVTHMGPLTSNQGDIFSEDPIRECEGSGRVGKFATSLERGSMLPVFFSSFSL